MNGIQMDAGVVASLITALGVIVALALNIGTLRTRGQTNNPAMIEMRADVKHIREKVDKTDMLVERQDQRADELDKRVVLVEASVKSAHHRIDEINKRSGGRTND